MIANSPQHDAAVSTEHRRLRKIVGEVGQLCRQPLPDEQFYPQYLQRLVKALTAAAGAVWLPDGNGDWQCRWRLDTDPARRKADANRLQRHLPCARKAAASEEALSFTDRNPAGAKEDDAVFVIALRREQEPIAVVEVVLPVPAVQAGRKQALAFLKMMAGLASARGPAKPNVPRVAAATVPRVTTAAVPRAEPGPASLPQGIARPLQQLSAFACAVRQSLDLETTGFLVANEMRSMLGCDRVSIAIANQDACSLVAISGQDAIDRRADNVRQLEALARMGLQSREAVWCDRQSADLTKKLAALGMPRHPAGVDSPWTHLGILPLRESPDDPAIGVAILEQISTEVSLSDLQRRVELAAPHAAQAIARARDHDEIFLRKLWQAIGRTKRLCATRGKRLLVWLAAILLAALFVGLFPIAFHVHGRGVLEPTRQRDVFADVDGVVTEVYVNHGDQVQPGDALVKLHNSNLELQLADVLGRRRAIQEHLAAIHRQRHEEQLERETTDRLTGQLLQLQEQLRGLDQQHALLLEKQNRLIVRSPIAGQVATWNLDRRLMLRPVAAGQILLSVADEAGPWQLEVYLPEADVGHLQTARTDSVQPLPVDFLAVTEPAKEHRGVLQQVDAHAQLYDDHGHAVRVLVKIDRTDLPDTPAGATVRARIQCGERSIGYVWLHRLVGFLYSRVLFRLG
ncbi:HlyD family secretion protein [Lignipirellula cremea]|uniref:HlyD family secretion protein n=2 Tax=Lignipirellula cremea TaxID=2528010 RepID=A0A518E4G4_9BACT|nr:HlyD family secretion protein [Lignipirellula cremea]